MSTLRDWIGVGIIFLMIIIGACWMKKVDPDREDGYN